MDGGSVTPTMTSTTASGSDAESVLRAGRPSRFCRIGSHPPHLSACVAGSRPVRVSPQAFRRASSTALQRPVALARFIHSPPLGSTSAAQLVVLGDGPSPRGTLFVDTHHRCLGS